MLLNISNDKWYRIMAVPFLGFLVPYFSPMIPEVFEKSFYQEYPSLYTSFEFTNEYN